jgi:hypothetical protein
MKQDSSLVSAFPTIKNSAYCTSGGLHVSLALLNLLFLPSFNICSAEIVYIGSDVFLQNICISDWFFHVHNEEDIPMSLWYVDAH